MELFWKHPAAFGDFFPPLLYLSVITGVRMDSPLHYITWHCLLHVDFHLFSDWPSRLTAFIAKELTRSRDIIEVQDSYIEEAISYLISKQKADGAWDDPNPLYDRGMKVQAAQTRKTVTIQQTLHSLFYTRSKRAFNVCVLRVELDNLRMTCPWLRMSSYPWFMLCLCMNWGQTQNW